MRPSSRRDLDGPVGATWCWQSAVDRVRVEFALGAITPSDGTPRARADSRLEAVRSAASRRSPRLRSRRPCRRRRPFRAGRASAMSTGASRARLARPQPRPAHPRPGASSTRCAPANAAACYSHSIVAGGFEERSRHTRLTCGISLMIASRSSRAGRRAGGPSRRSSRPRRYRPDDDRVGVRARVALHADRADGRQHGEALPELAVEPGAAHLLVRIASASRRISSRSRVTSPMIGSPGPGPGNGCRQTIASGSPSSSRPAAHLVLEEHPQRLDELEVDVLGQAADVVVGLDLRGDARRCPPDSITSE